MPRETADFKTSYNAWVEESSAGSGPHLLLEEVISLQRGDLAGEERSRLREHLLGCRECFQIWRDLRSFVDDGTAPLPEAVTDLEAARFVRRLRPRLSASGTRPRSAPGPKSFPPRWRLALAAAAAVVAVLGLSSWVATLQRAVADRDRAIAELARPRPNVPIYDLTLDTGRRGGEPRVSEIPAGVGFTVILTPEKPATHPVYQLAIFDSEEVETHRVDNLQSNAEDDTFTLWVPPSFLEVGEYRLELAAGADGGESIASFRLRIVRPDG